MVAYVGFPLTDHAGNAVGSLCAIDSVPREWTADEIDVLEDLALACSAEWNQLEQARVTRDALAAAEELGERSRTLLALSESLSFTETLADVATAVGHVSAGQLGCIRAGMWLRDSHVSLARAPLPSSGHPAEALRFVEDATSTWHAARKFTELPLDTSNPLGTVLIERAPIFYSTRREQNADYPHLSGAEQDGEGRAFLPQTVAGRAYGALALMWPTERSFSDEDRITVAALATCTAQAVYRAQLLHERLDVAWTLQRSMLTELPQPDHLDLAARYLPAAEREQVGGDWYDAVVMPGGAMHLVIGDIEGHDIDAAAVMGQLRNMLRAFAWLPDSTPRTALEQLDRAAHDLEVPKVASVVLARIEQTFADAQTGMRRLRWSNAGHQPPLLIAPDPAGDGPATATYLDGASGPDPILGLRPDGLRRDNDIAIGPESTLLLFTVGLTERRGEHPDIALEQLRRAAVEAAHLPLDRLLDLVLQRMDAHRTDDDIAVLAVRFGAET